MTDVAIAALQNQNIFLSSLIQVLKLELEKLGEKRPPYEEVVEIAGQCYASASQTLNAKKRERLRKVLLAGMSVQDREQEEDHALLL